MQVNVKATSFFLASAQSMPSRKIVGSCSSLIRLVMPAVCAQVLNVRAVWAVDALFLQYRAFLLDTCPELYIF